MKNKLLLFLSLTSIFHLTCAFWSQLPDCLSNGYDILNRVSTKSFMKHLLLREAEKGFKKKFKKNLPPILSDLLFLSSQKTDKQWRTDNLIKASINTFTYYSDNKVNYYKVCLSEFGKLCAQECLYKIFYVLLEKYIKNTKNVMVQKLITNHKRIFTASIVSVFIIEQIYNYYLSNKINFIPKKCTAEEELEKTKNNLNNLTEDFNSLKEALDIERNKN